MVQSAVMGYGVVGSGVVEVLSEHKESIAKRTKQEIGIKYILDIREFPDSPFKDKFTKSFDDILNDEEVKVVAEVMGGVHPAYEFTKQLLESGKSVVTSNKELVATKGAELLKIAKEHNVNYLFEASVGGGIPIIRPLSQCLAANDVIEIAGILNGTTNFNVYPDFVHTQGITKIALEDVSYAAAWGGVIKLIGKVKRLEDDTLDITVEPMFIEKNSQLANVDDVFNGILVRGDSTGDVVFYGKGAGKLPTASAVVADIMDCVKHLGKRKYLDWADGDGSIVKPYEQTAYPVYIRVKCDDKQSAFNKAQELFSDVSAIVRANEPADETAFVTGEMTVSAQEKAVKAFEDAGFKVVSKIRISDL